jgi:autotransporter strand-loop-strand O-heptosyltransferase
MFKDKKVLIITPHLSTGGCPQYLLEFLNNYLKDFKDCIVIEHSNFSNEFVIQKNKIKDLIGDDKLITLGDYGEKDPIFTLKRKQLINIVEEFNPDIIWMNEFPEAYDYQLPPNEVMDFLYRKEREYKIVETTHYNAFNFENKRFVPDEFMFCSEIHIEKSKNINIPKYIWEVPINKKERPNRRETLKSLGLDPNTVHILNVGLFHENKNQKYIFELAKKLQNKNIEFHFIGNTCFLNDCGIGEDLNLPNCNIWGERDDVDKFMSCMDIYLFPSKKELNPLTVKEALSWGMDVIVNRDENYTHQYENINNFYILDEINIEDVIEKHNNFGKFLLVTSFFNVDKKYVDLTFDNVLKQTYKNWRLIVGDDFSEDKSFRQYVKNKIIEINDPRIIYYDVKFKRELFLQQNFFKYFDYDYYFDLDSDDIIHDRILEIYNKYFIKYPDVYSIFSNFYETDKNLNVQKFGLIQPPDDYIEEYNYRTNTDTNLLWFNRPYYSMYGVGRCMRRPLDNKLKIVENVKTSADTLMLFYNLIRGKHLHIPRNLYTYVRRPNSDSAVIMSTEEYSKFNINAEKYIKKYSKIEPTGCLDLFKELWFETSALSTCEFINDVDNITLISEINEEDKKVINELYFDKKIDYNNPNGENLIIVYNKLPKNFEWDMISAKNVTIYHYNDDYSYSKDDMFDRFNQVNNQIVVDISKNFNGFTWFNFFRHLVITKKENVDKNTINITYNDGVKVDITGKEDKKYLLKFYNDDTNELVYESIINTNMWSSSQIKYYVKWRVEVWSEGKILKKEVLDLTNEDVLIYFDSKSLGDSIAWIPYVDEFRRKHNCKVTCVTFKNFLYEKSYPNINFVNIGEPIKQHKATYNIGWFFDNTKNPRDVRLISLQQTASDILGLRHKEIRTTLDYKPKMKTNNLGKYVTLSIQSTSQCKYWNKIGGWDKVVKYLNNKGYKVICIDQHSSFGVANTMNFIPKGVIDFTGKSLDEISELICHSEFHLGISSGISWLAWGLRKKVVIVSSFSKPFCEFEEDCYRVYNDVDGSGYFNTLEQKFNPSDWNWNPFKKIKNLKEWDKFENIEVKDVIEKIDEVL